MLTLLSPIESGMDSPFVNPPLYPCLDWFTDEALDAAPPKLTLYPSGRVAGVVAPAGRCLLDGTDDCWTVPRPEDGRGSTLFRDGGDDEDYSAAMVGSTWVEIYEGAGEYIEIPTACLAGPGGHADAFVNVQATRIHYDDTDFQVARGRYGWSDVAGGVVFVGAVWPDLTERQIATARASACSIDYRFIQDERRWRLIATCLVNVGGLPSRYSALAAAVAAGQTLLISDQMRLDLMAAAEGEIERAAVCASLGLRPSTLSGDDPAAEDPMKTQTPPTPPTIEPPAPESVHAHTAAPGETCACGKTVEQDHPAVVAASTDGAPVPEDFAHAEAAAGQSDDEAEARRAAFVVVDTGSAPDWGDEITWSGGVGMFCDSITMLDGSVIWLVYPQVNGEIDWDVVAMPASAGTATGREYDYLDPWDYDLDSVVLEPAGDDAAEAIEDAAMASVAAAAGRWEEDENGARRIAALGARLAAGRKLTSQARTPVEHRVAAVAKSSDERMDRLENMLGQVVETVSSLSNSVAASLVSSI